MDPINATRTFVNGLELWVNISVNQDNIAIDATTETPLTKDEINARRPCLDEDILAAGIKIIDVN